MKDVPRLMDGAATDPAVILLRSAQSDKPLPGSKERMRAMLGISEAQDAPPVLPVRIEALLKRVPDARAKRNRKIARLIPFQHVMAPEKRFSLRKVGPVAVAFVQVAAMIAALFVRPLPRIEPPPAADTHRDEPELSFFVPKAKVTASKPTENRLAENTPSGTSARKEGFGTLVPSRPARGREPIAPRESIVGDEHAGALAENEPPTVFHAMTPESAVEVSTARVPMLFQEGMNQPVRVAGTDPTYPQIARLRGVQGLVIMRCLLTEKGLAENCTILKSPAYLDDAVLSATRSWRFTPVKWQGRAVPVQYVFKYNFKLG